MESIISQGHLDIPSGGLNFPKKPPSSGRLHGYLTVFGGLCIHLFCGNLYLWGNIQNYVVSYYHYNVNGHQADPNSTLAIAVMVLPLSGTIQAFASPLGTYLLKKWHPKVIMLIGSSIMVFSVLIASYAQTWWMFVIFYAVIFPFGVGLVYWTPIICGWEWFPERKGLVSGVIIGGFGFGAFIFGFISTAIANPNNLKPSVPHDGSGFSDNLFPVEVAVNVPTMLRTCLTYWTALAIISCLCVSRNPEYDQNRASGEKEPSTRNPTRPEKAKQDDTYITVKEALSTRRFWHMALMLLFGIYYGLMLVNIYKLAAQDVLSDKVLTIAGAVGSVCNGTSRIVWASFQDKYGFKKVYRCLLGL